MCVRALLTTFMLLKKFMKRYGENSDFPVNQNTSKVTSYAAHSVSPRLHTCCGGSAIAIVSIGIAWITVLVNVLAFRENA